MADQPKKPARDLDRDYNALNTLEDQLYRVNSPLYQHVTKYIQDLQKTGRFSNEQLQQLGEAEIYKWVTHNSFGGELPSDDDLKELGKYKASKRHADLAADPKFAGAEKALPQEDTFERQKGFLDEIRALAPKPVQAMNFSAEEITVGSNGGKKGILTPMSMQGASKPAAPATPDEKLSEAQLMMLYNLAGGRMAPVERTFEEADAASGPGSFEALQKLAAAPTPAAVQPAAATQPVGPAAPAAPMDPDTLRRLAIDDALGIKRR